jgi:phosphinothricin acetyltransferase
MRLLEQAGYRHLLAVIGDSANGPSIGLHTRAGFKHVGKLERVGFKFGRWIDVVLMQKQLGEGADSVPKDTLPCEELPSA